MIRERFPKILWPILYLLSLAYHVVVRLRNSLYDTNLIPSVGVKIPVISVGNVTVGGNAKTPIVIFIAKILKQRGYSPAILSRGYGGSAKGPIEVSPDSRWTEVGDEPKLLAIETNVPVVVAKKRVAGAEFIERNRLGDVIILDDGFQHRRLKRTINLLTFNISNINGISESLTNRMLPFGPCREPLLPALERTDGIIFSERRLKSFGDSSGPLLKVVPAGIPIFSAHLSAELPRDLSSQAELKPPTEIAAFCGLANPDGFFQTLEDLGFTVVKRVALPDHKGPSDEVLAELRSLSLPIVCTAKDLVKLSSHPEGFFVLRVTTRVVPEDAFLVFLLKRLVKGKKSTE